MSKDIATWLENGSNYSEGVSLYEKYGSDDFLIRILKKGENAFNKQKLAEALGGVLIDGKPEPPAPEPLPVEPPAASAPAEPRISPPPPGELPELLKVTNQIAANFAELRGLHPYLSITPEGEQLRQVALRIQRLGVRNSELMMMKNNIIENGYETPEPEEIKAPVMIDYNLIREKESIRKSLNKAENRLKKQSNPKDYTLALIAQRKKDLADINARIAEAKLKGAADGKE
ncbi:hypothetical protein ACTJKN_05195 [Pedobacter sp. 22163]|uniref:hypothetical protein n=1 Tax=Pedobacter sp. 22163 TaxID=3453883 RepID=UPI003F8670E0